MLAGVRSAVGFPESVAAGNERHLRGGRRNGKWESRINRKKEEDYEEVKNYRLG